MSANPLHRYSALVKDLVRLVGGADYRLGRVAGAGGRAYLGGCEVEAMHEAGDHYVVLGRVAELGECGREQPLLFYRGRYGMTEPSAGPPEVVDTLLAWPRHADWI